ncbi:PfkB family carbohydrate kinase [Gymnodinialimonas sp.]
MVDLVTAKTVAAVSSFVMRGAVGLRANVFALERRGVTVWAVPTVLLPWHPGLGPSTRTPSADLPRQLDELADHAAALDGVLTGYFASAAQVVAAAGFIDRLRAVRPDALVVVDPVTGDEGGRYVPDAVADAIHRELVPRADVITPNINELRDMAGDTAPASVRALGVPQVIVTSALGDAEMTGSTLVTPDRIASVTHNCVSDVARGTGDLFAGVLMAALVAGMDGPAALREASAATLAVLSRSGSEALDLGGCQDLIAAPDLSAVRLVSGAGG